VPTLPERPGKAVLQHVFSQLMLRESNRRPTQPQRTGLLPCEAKIRFDECRGGRSIVPIVTLPPCSWFGARGDFPRRGIVEKVLPGGNVALRRLRAGVCTGKWEWNSGSCETFAGGSGLPLLASWAINSGFRCGPFFSGERSCERILRSGWLVRYS